MLIEDRSPHDPELARLVVAQQRELRQADGGLDGQVTVVHDDASYLVGIVEGEVVACGALQAIDAETAELKRMYVCPSHRGRGLARRMIAELERRARSAGYVELWLETGVYLPAAIALYTSSGYTPIPVYGEYVDNPFSVCFGKTLRVRV